MKLLPSQVELLKCFSVNTLIDFRSIQNRFYPPSRANEDVISSMRKRCNALLAKGYLKILVSKQGKRYKYKITRAGLEELKRMESK